MRGTGSKGPYKKGYSILGSRLGSAVLGSYQMSPHRLPQNKTLAGFYWVATELSLSHIIQKP